MLEYATVLRTIRAVVVRRHGGNAPAETLRDLSIGDLAVAIRFDRTPQTCVDELHRLASLNKAFRTSRGLFLSEIHGMTLVRAYADRAITDLAAWRRGKISWDAV